VSTFTARDQVRTDPYFHIQRQTFEPLDVLNASFSFNLYHSLGERSVATVGGVSVNPKGVGPAWEISVGVSQVVEGVGCGLFVYLREFFITDSGAQVSHRWLVNGNFVDGFFNAAGTSGERLTERGNSHAEVLVLQVDYVDAANIGKLNADVYFAVQSVGAP
jgi:hypothetical protein